MSRWTHATCKPCWDIKYPNRTPATVKHEKGETVAAEVCCYCGIGTFDGIYTRHDPDAADILCKGVHEGD